MDYDVNAMYPMQMAKNPFNLPSTFVKYDEAIVDGATWYSVWVTTDILSWVESMPKNLRYIHLEESGAVDVHEQIYNMMVLKWS